ncbi:glycosyltransferase family 4 protein [Nitratireductor aquimarinus]|uniref:glycosyltransferase family 4 protein n=1 Tax=Nitratireductor TaxID=245876 RepID=UPI0019D4016F|nr:MULTISPECIES: glycosyltransferase family 4 protein [Nitratireductor]MBN7777460.1 glycosyltransferase family 4 protein [Nitratireductor pacificus]MBN7781453.1 glycosyltransferase family 4 protein [Nitratireductor pacificus]MBN7790259.1 glycosyltransferase family 4 protein [Nitratireductor aquimarinus]MBY6099669.1 glycosyltransferase family 4 protein [Nitratireductor aquimarinus]MCA1261749.1 glycosyltransferase family 4 protein [Nitratireductor aquimarinus]
MINFRGPLIEDLVARGHKVFALVPDIDASACEAILALGAKPVEIALSRTGTNPVKDLGSVICLRQKLAEIRPDVTLGYAAKPAIYGMLASWILGIPARFAMIEGLGYVFIARSGERNSKRVLRSIVSTLFRLALRRADKVFFLNQDDAADFLSMGLVRSDQPIIIGGIGVDLATWSAAEPMSKPITFTFVGRLLRDKGVLDFVSAARLVKGSTPDARFVVVGGVDDNPESIGELDVESWVAEGIVEWPGHVPVRPWLEQTSVFVLPSYREGVPRSTQEAMAMARAVITTDAVGCRDTVIDGRNGFLVPVSSPNALAAAMQRFIDTPELIASMGAESRAMAEERYDVRKINAVIINGMGL